MLIARAGRAGRGTLVLAAPFLTTIVTAASPAPAQTALELIEVSGPAASAAGLEPGHRLRSAAPPPPSGEVVLSSPFVLDLLAVDWAPRGGVELVGEVDGASRRWRLDAGPWGLRAALPLGPSLDAAYRAALEPTAGAEVVRALTETLDAERGLALPTAAWLWREVGRLASARLDRDTADDAYARALASLSEATAAWRDGAAVLVRLDRARSALAASRWDRAREEVQAATETAPVGTLLAAAVIGVHASLAQRVGEIDEAERLFAEALALREALAPGSYVVAATLDDLAQVALNRDDASRGEELASRALELQRAAGLEREAARSLRLLGGAAMVRDELDAADAALAEAEEILARADPDSTERIATYVQRGIIAQRRGRIDEAEQRFEAARSLAERLEPEGVGLPSILNNLGVIAWRRGDLALAEQRWRDAAERLEAIAPGNTGLPIFLMNLATATKTRGDFVTAEGLYRRVLELRRRVAPRAKTVGISLNNLGGMRKELGDLDGAERYYRESLEIHQELAPDGLDAALVMVNLAQVARERGDLDGAEQLLRRSLEIRERLAPRSGPHATSHANLGGLALERGDLDDAQQSFTTALELREAQAPGGLEVAISLQDLGRLAQRRGDLGAAEERHRAALAIRRRLAPGTLREAESWHHLGLAQRAGGRPAEAEQSLCHATEVLDRLEPDIAAAEEDRASFRAELADYYRECLDAQLAAGRPRLAFATLERSRARSLLLQLSERDLDLDAELPDELAAAIRRNRLEADRILGDLARNDGTSDPAALRELGDRLAELNEERARLRAEMRAASPRLAGLRQPETLDWEGAARALDPGTALLAYSTGERRTLLFVVRGAAPGGDPPPLEVLPIALGREVLDARVRALRESIARRQAPDPVLDRVTAELYAALLAPAEPLLEGAERLLISPDGPLHVLPFSALAPAGDGEGRSPYLIERWALHFVLSATVYRELRSAPEPAQPTLIAFGDPGPESAQTPLPSTELRAYLGSVSELRPLPWARQEVLALESLFDDRARVFTGEAASEARVKRLAPEAGYLHFATHGLLSERFPLSSALRLAEEGDENGLLEAWEIIEQLRLDARLVTLSSCESALGRELGGEGLIGLTRAFQFAGARAVLASIWQVADRATAELMRRTYSRIAAGDASLDDALRDAQVSLLAAEALGAGAGPEETRAVGGLARRGTDWRHPFYWAGFQLYGDPR
ncbi:MAG TPA: CHAT domain-containing protein [Thermoanaerobaculia bacterium]|nr:CHAT domain-containing protein [Thermoanaerobaculia bacterium]